MYFQKSGFKGIGEKKPLLTLLEADGHISAAQLDHLAGAELTMRYGRTDRNAGNIDLRLFGLFWLCGNDWGFHAESSSDEIRFRWRRLGRSVCFLRFRLLIRFRNIGLIDFRRIHRGLLVIEQQLILLALHDGMLPPLR